MTRSDDGWFEAEADCGAGTHYRYVLQDGTRVPDPASRAQSGDVHDDSIVVDSVILSMAPARLAWPSLA